MPKKSLIELCKEADLLHDQLDIFRAKYKSADAFSTSEEASNEYYAIVNKLGSVIPKIIEASIKIRVKTH